MPTDGIMEFIKQLEVILIIVVPALYALFWKIHKSIKDKNDELQTEDKHKRIEFYRRWEHEESTRIISKIKGLCNYYKDRNPVDLVAYYQIENGTVATSKLCNMFMTCLAEDDRYGKITKQLTNLQRIPYSQVSAWIDLVRSGSTCIGDIDVVQNAALKDIAVSKGEQSCIAEDVKDSGGCFIGICEFEYSDKYYNDNPEVSQKEALHDFKVAVQTIFLDYHLARDDKMKELKLSPMDLN